MNKYRMTLIEAQRAIRDAQVNRLDEDNRILMRELAWIRSALTCGDYPSRQFRESVNTIFQCQRTGQRFYYGATERRVALICDGNNKPLVIRWHDGAKGSNYTNEHPIDLKELFRLMRSRAETLTASDVYDHICAIRLLRGCRAVG
jgi:hypothetical protein